jgi:hypothetical protein
MTVMPTTIDTDMAKGADVPKMTTEFVVTEILRHIREESIDPPIGEEAEGVLEGLRNDPLRWSTCSVKSAHRNAGILPAVARIPARYS